MSTTGQKHFYMETQVTLAEPGENGKLVVTCATQALTVVKAELGLALKKLASKITVKNNRLGGA
jgi:xanthine dehydrogenase molybdopterin-binding subunit B